MTRQLFHIGRLEVGKGQAWSLVAHCSKQAEGFSYLLGLAELTDVINCQAKCTHYYCDIDHETNQLVVPLLLDLYLYEGNLNEGN